MLVGLAVGDALGAPYEFGWRRSDEIEQLGERIGDFVASVVLPAGVWTDDTSMALCLADSLIENKGYDSYDVMQKYLDWMQHGYRGFNGLPALDVGRQTADAIETFSRNPIIPKIQAKTFAAGNGAIMRLAPVIIANAFSDREPDHKLAEANLQPIVDMAVISCRETHDSIAAECVTAMFAVVLYAALCGLTKSEILAYGEKGIDYNDDYHEFWLENSDQLVDRYKRKNAISELKDLGGYIVDAYAIALWGFKNSESFEEGMLKVIRLGGDTDTNAAVYGQLAGAYYGYAKIPQKWRDGVYLADELVKIADDLLNLEECPIIKTRFEDDKYFRLPNGVPVTI